MIYSNDPIQYVKEKRKKPDPIMQIIHLSNGLVWLILIAFLLTTNAAMPPVETFFDRLFDVQLREHWDFRLLRTGQWILVGLFVVSGVGIYLNTKRLKRQDDHMRVSLIITAVFSFIGSIVMLFVMA